MRARSFVYPEGMEDEEMKKTFEHGTLEKEPEVLYEHRKKTGIRCDLIFFTRSGPHYMAAIEEAYPDPETSRMEENKKFKLKLSNGATVSIFDSGIIMIQGTEKLLEEFENRFDTIKQNVNRR